MIVIADASPLVALTICESLDILDKLFENVKVSQAVYEEVTVSDKLGSDKILRSSQIYFNPNLLDYALQIVDEYD